MSVTLDRLIQANPEEAEAWALRSIINSLQVMRNFDSGTKPLEMGRSAAERARRIAPGSPLGELALGMHLAAMFSRGSDVQVALPHVQRGVAGLPRDALTRYAELTSLWLGYQFDATERSARAWLADQPRASFPAWILGQLNVARRQPEEAVKWAGLAAADSDITGIRARVTTFEARYYLQADLPAARAALEQIPPSASPPHRLLFARWLLAMAERQWDQALRELTRVPDPILFDRNYHGPKALLAGLAHRGAGRTDAALAQLRESERLLRADLASDPDNEELHAVLAVTLASAGRADDARNELAAIEPLMRGRAPSVYTGGMITLIAQAHGAMGDMENTIPWLRKLFMEPSALPFTPASLRIDPRFERIIAAPPVQALLAEFAALDPPKKAAVGPDNKSVAVLAFADLSADKDGEYFSDGISEELLNVLAKVPGLRVAARTSAFYFKGKNTPIPDIAKQLNVGYVVEGSVRKAGSRIRITAQLINAADGFHVWSDNFDRELKDIFAVQDEIAGLIAQKLQLTLGAGTRVTKVVDPEAYKLYLEARQYAITLSVDNWSRGEKLYSQALDIDPHFTRAAAGLVLLRATRVGNECVALRFHDQQLAEIEREARELLLRDPGLGEAHAALGGVYTSRDDVAAAEAEYQHADRLGFSPEQSANVRPFLHFRRGRPDLAIAAMEEARRNNPLAWVPVDVGGLGLLFCGRYAEAADALGRATRMGSAPSAFANYALALVGLGRNDEAIAAARAALEVANRADRQDGFLAVSDGNAAWALARAGARAEAEAVARRLQAGPVASRYTAGLAIAELGRLDEALVLLDDLVPSPMLGFLFFFLNDRPALGADPRVTALLRKHRAVEEFETFRRVVAEQQSARATRNP